MRRRPHPPSGGWRGPRRGGPCAEPAGRLGGDQEADDQERAGDDREREHRAPVVVRGQGVVGEVGEEDAHRDGQLVRRDDAPTDPGGRHLGRVERPDGGREADRQARDHPPDGQNGGVVGDRLEQRSPGEEDAGDDRRPAAADPVGERARDQRAHERAERDPARDHLGGEGAEAEILLHQGQGARDDSLVVAEQQTCQECDHSDHHEPWREATAGPRRGRGGYRLGVRARERRGARLSAGLAIRQYFTRAVQVGSPPPDIRWPLPIRARRPLAAPDRPLRHRFRPP